MSEEEISARGSGFSHLDARGQAHMVDVGDKPITRRSATATAICYMSPSTAESIRQDTVKKGEVLQVARLAGIGAAKRTDELIPLCHQVPLDRVETRFDWLDSTRLRISVSVQATARTGVEMEALVAVSTAALTIYDMCKSLDRELSIQNIQLERKSGGRSGDFQRNQLRDGND